MAHAFRVHQLARELGITSAAIIEKCRDNGVPEEVICTHMSPLSPELAAKIREWLRTHHEGGDGLAGA